MMKNHVPLSEYIAYWRKTRRTETSKYPEEEKENSIFKVAASEMERAQLSNVFMISSRISWKA